MQNIDGVLRAINRDLAPAFADKLRAELAEKDRDWLIEQIVRLTLDRHSLEELDRQTERDSKARRRAERIARVKELAIDASAVRSFIDEFSDTTRESLQAGGFLSVDAPPKGTSQLVPSDRGDEGDALLERAKDMMYGLLFGGADTATHLDRTQQELLTFALPRFKAAALDFMRASTELSAAGTWQDPDSVSNDERADNVVLEVQYGDTDDEIVGEGLITALTLINNLEVNEQVLYARMMNIEQSTLIT
jgi:hypothetical protein